MPLFDEKMSSENGFFLIQMLQLTFAILNENHLGM